MNPKRMKVDQPLRLMIVGFDDSGIEASDRVIIDCAYEGGLEGALTGRHPEFPITFRQFDPVIPADGYNVTSLSASGVSVSGASFGSILLVTEDTGTTTAITGFGGEIYGITEGMSGGMYIYGLYVNYAGSADLDGIVYRDSAGTISALSSGVQAAVFDAEYGIDGKLYVASAASTMSGVVGADYIASWDGATFDPLATGVNNNVFSVCPDNSGNIYIAGMFTQANTGPVTLNYFGKWNGTAWSACTGVSADGFSAPMYGLVALPDDTIVICGGATVSGGDTTVKYLATWNGASYGTLGDSPDGIVHKIVYDNKRGVLYAVGTFTQIGGVTSNNIAFWDGSNWNAMPGYAEPSGFTIYNYIYVDTDTGELFAYGTFTIKGMTFTNTIGTWNGSEWKLAEYKSDQVIYAMFPRYRTNEIALCGFAASGDVDLTYTVPAVSTITNSTEGNIYPSGHT